MTASTMATHEAALTTAPEANSKEAALQRAAGAIARWLERICAENPERAREIEEALYGSRRTTGEEQVEAA